MLIIITSFPHFMRPCAVGPEKPRQVGYATDRAMAEQMAHEAQGSIHSMGNLPAIAR